MKSTLNISVLENLLNDLCIAGSYGFVVVLLLLSACKCIFIACF